MAKKRKTLSTIAGSDYPKAGKGNPDKRQGPPRKDSTAGQKKITIVATSGRDNPENRKHKEAGIPMAQVFPLEQGHGRSKKRRSRSLIS